MQEYYEGTSDDLCEVKTIVAAINDEYSLKSRETIHLLYEWLPEGTDGNKLDSLVEFLNTVIKEESHEFQNTANEILRHLSDIELNKYVDYMREIEEREIKFLPFYSVLYPQALWKISHPPLGLYIRGEKSGLFGGIAIVGTRDATDHRRDFAKDLAKSLASDGHTIVSGLANGIDEMAHKGAIEASGTTIAVLPGGVETIRPSSNKGLAEDIVEYGSLVGEMSDETNIHRGRFVERNRITSGLSVAVVVVASKNSGGTVRQAEFAKEQSRPRFMYDPGANDGQSPDKLARLGLKRFATIEEFHDKLNSNWKSIQSNGPLAQLSEE